MPGVFAVGDVRAGSVKRVASAVGEGSICVQFVHRVLREFSGSGVRNRVLTPDALPFWRVKESKHCGIFSKFHQ